MANPRPARSAVEARGDDPDLVRDPADARDARDRGERRVALGLALDGVALFAHVGGFLFGVFAARRLLRERAAYGRDPAPSYG
jgi:hypothetical protein